MPYHRRGRVVGAIELSWSSAWLLGVPASGFLIERLGWRAPWAVLIGGWLWQWESIALQAGVGAACALVGTVLLARGLTEVA